VIGNDFDLTNNKFSYKPLKELASKVPGFPEKLRASACHDSGQAVAF